MGTAEPEVWQIAEDGYRAIEDARCDVVKLMCPRVTDGMIDRLRRINPNMTVMVRLFGKPPELVSPEVFANHVRDNLRLAYAMGVRLAEVHNEPNLPGEGLGQCWRDGWEFAQFWLRAVALLRPEFPEMRWGFPGLSPVANFHTFIGQAQEAVRAADWLGVHIYWDNIGSTWESGRDALRTFCHDHADKPVWVTEFSRQRGLDLSAKAEEYLRFVTAPYPANLRGMIGFVLGRAGMNDWESESWVGSPIPEKLAERVLV